MQDSLPPKKQSMDLNSSCIKVHVIGILMWTNTISI